MDKALEDLKKQIDEIEFNIRVCSRHTQFMHEMKKITSSDESLTIDYDRQIGQNAYKRMILQDKLRFLMNQCIDLQDKMMLGDYDE